MKSIICRTAWALSLTALIAVPVGSAAAQDEFPEPPAAMMRDQHIESQMGVLESTQAAPQTSPGINVSPTRQAGAIGAGDSPTAVIGDIGRPPIKESGAPAVASGGAARMIGSGSPTAVIGDIGSPTAVIGDIGGPKVQPTVAPTKVPRPVK